MEGMGAPETTGPERYAARPYPPGDSPEGISREEEGLLAALASIDSDAITPLEALEIMAGWKKKYLSPSPARTKTRRRDQGPETTRRARGEASSPDLFSIDELQP
jgi:hypothetical protein